MEFSAELFVDKLLNDGANHFCDNTSDCFKNQMVLPSYYDEVKFQRNKQFYNDNIFTFMLGKLMGLMAELSIPNIRNILMHTNRSNEPVTAYKRYMATVLYVNIWYNEGRIYENNSLWNTIKRIRNVHNAASNSSNNNKLGRITQKDMALTQFGFLGFILVRANLLGIYTFNNENKADLIHFWRVLGYLLGIDERFNLCRESVEETEAICNELITRVYIPAFIKREPDFYTMSKALIDGMYAMLPFLHFQAYFQFYIKLLSETNEEMQEIFEDEFRKLEPKHVHIYNNIFIILISRLKESYVRKFLNTFIHFILWCNVNFPFLAYYLYGWTTVNNFHFELIK